MLSALTLVFLPSSFFISKTTFTVFATFLGLALLSSLNSPGYWNCFQVLGWWLAGLAIGIALAGGPPETRQFCWTLLFVLAPLQTILGISQILKLPFLPNVLIPSHRWAVTGTLGNPEFLATYLGIAFLYGAEKWIPLTPSKIKRLALFVLLVIFIGIALTRTKGTLLFLFIYFLSRFQKKYWRGGMMGVMGLIGIGLIFPASSMGRILVWTASVMAMGEHPLLGVGPGQAGNAYIENIQRLFTIFPSVAHRWGSHTASITDAHNLLLNFGAELGFFGFLFGLWIVYQLLKVIREETGFLAWGTGFLLFKSSYTVVLGSPTGIILSALVLATELKATHKNTPSMPMTKMAGALFLPFLGLSFWLGLAPRLYDQGLKSLSQGDLRGAEKKIEQSLSFNPHYAEAHLGLAHVYFLKKENAPMDTQLQDAVRFQPKIDTMKKAAHMYFLSGLYEKAETLFNVLHVVYPEHLTPMIRLAQIYEQRGDWRGSRQWALQVIETEPRVKSDSYASNKRLAGEMINRFSRKELENEH